MKKEHKELYQRIAEEQPRCAICGSTEMLEIHHIIYGSLHGSRDSLTYYENLIRLCKKHHLEVHKNKKYWVSKLQDIREEIK